MLFLDDLFIVLKSLRVGNLKIFICTNKKCRKWEIETKLMFFMRLLELIGCLSNKPRTSSDTCKKERNSIRYKFCLIVKTVKINKFIEH